MVYLQLDLNFGKNSVLNMELVQKEYWKILQLRELTEKMYFSIKYDLLNDINCYIEFLKISYTCDWWKQFSPMCVPTVLIILFISDNKG